MMQTMFEKLQLAEEKNLLIQGLPSSIEKQFAKISFAKNVTPLLKTKKIDFALVFAISQNQLNGILKDVLPALNDAGKLWVAYPKTTSKIVSDLNRDCSWHVLNQSGFESVRQVTLDHVWTAMRFSKLQQIKLMTRASPNIGDSAEIEGVDPKNRTVTPPRDLENLFAKHRKAKDCFEKLSFTNKKEWVKWISEVKTEGIRQSRLETTLEKLVQGMKNPGK
jgi:hypothetical protein